MKHIGLVTVAGMLALTACDGPREQAGEVADNQAGAVGSEDTLRSGPAESLGERQDEAAESAEDARDAEGDALEEKAEAQRKAADEQAELLEQQADKVRNGQ